MLWTAKANRLVARGAAHTALLLIPFARESRLEFCLLAWWDEERMLLRVLDDLFGHNLALEAPQCAFNRLTLVNSNYRHSFSVFL